MGRCGDRATLALAVAPLRRGAPQYGAMRGGGCVRPLARRRARDRDDPRAGGEPVEPASAMRYVCPPEAEQVSDTVLDLNDASHYAWRPRLAIVRAAAIPGSRSASDQVSSRGSGS
jgi:hypothetical protein